MNDAPSPNEPLDLGHGHTLRFVAWQPDRELNPQYADIPDCDRVGAYVYHSTPDGKPCSGYVCFDTAPEPLRGDNTQTWHVESSEPLTLSPSLLCRGCGDHGFVREGRWQPA